MWEGRGVVKRGFEKSELFYFEEMIGGYLVQKSV